VTLAKDIGLISGYINAPVMVLGDLLQQGEEQAERFLEQMAEEKVKSHIALEFFAPPSRGFLEKVSQAIPNFDIQISPESHDEKVRKTFGRPYTNESFERFIRDALETGCNRIDVFFMIGLPFQTSRSVMDTIDYCESLLEQFGTGDNKGKLLPFISPLAPFLDPGSRAFEDPGTHGYRLFYRTLREHTEALLKPSWKQTLNYETEWMTRDEIVSSTYEASLKLNRMKYAYGILNQKEKERIELRIQEERDLMTEIDRILAEGEEGEQQQALESLLKPFDSLGASTICRKDEMNWPVRILRFNPFRITCYFMSHYIKKALKKIGIL